MADLLSFLALGLILGTVIGVIWYGRRLKRQAGEGRVSSARILLVGLGIIAVMTVVSCLQLLAQVVSEPAIGIVNIESRALGYILLEGMTYALLPLLLFFTFAGSFDHLMGTRGERSDD